MGLFDKTSGTQSLLQDGLNSAEAFAAITLAATASDGYPSQEQVRAISSTLLRMKLFRNYSEEMMSKMLDKLLLVLRHEGMDALFNVAKDSLNDDLREAAFAVATDLVLIDGSLNQEDKEFLNDLYQALGLASEIATPIMQVMLIKNRG